VPTGQDAHVSGGLQQMFEVVQHDEHALLTEVIAECFDCVSVLSLRRTERTSDCRRNERRFGQGRQVDKPDVGKRAVDPHRVGNGNCQASFTYAPGPMSVSSRTSAASTWPLAVSSSSARPISLAGCGGRLPSPASMGVTRFFAVVPFFIGGRASRIGQVG
jgi:hypothetical protein